MTQYDNTLHVRPDQKYRAVPEAQARRVTFNNASFVVAVREDGDLEIEIDQPVTIHANLDGSIRLVLGATEDSH